MQREKNDVGFGLVLLLTGFMAYVGGDTIRQGVETENQAISLFGLLCVILSFALVSWSAYKTKPSIDHVNPFHTQTQGGDDVDNRGSLPPPFKV